MVFEIDPELGFMCSDLPTMNDEVVFMVGLTVCETVVHFKHL